MRAALPLLAAGLVAGNSAWAQDCPLPDHLIQEAETAIVDGRQDVAAERFIEVQAAFGCSEPATVEQIARMWNAEGARLHLSGDPTTAADAFAAAARVSPMTWNADFGPELKAARDTAAAAGRGAGGAVQLEPDPGEFQSVLDGQEVDNPTPASSGLHLVQVLDTDGLSLYGTVVYVPPGEELVVDTGPLVTRVDPNAKQRRPWLLIAGGTALVGAGGAAALALRQTQVMNEASTVGALDDALGRQKLWNAVTWSAAGVGGVCLGLHFVL